jgi:prophage antirepressor-like protein
MIYIPNVRGKNGNNAFTDNQSFFAIIDVCRVLGLQNVSQSLAAIDKDDIHSIDVTEKIDRKQKSY